MLAAHRGRQGAAARHRRPRRPAAGRGRGSPPSSSRPRRCARRSPGARADRAPRPPRRPRCAARPRRSGGRTPRSATRRASLARARARHGRGGRPARAAEAPLEAQAADLQRQAASLQSQAADLQAQEADLKALQATAAAAAEAGRGAEEAAHRDAHEGGRRLPRHRPAPGEAPGRPDRDAAASRCVSPPDINKSGDAAIFNAVAHHGPRRPTETADLVKTVRSSVIPEATAGEDVHGLRRRLDRRERQPRREDLVAPAAGDRHRAGAQLPGAAGRLPLAAGAASGGGHQPAVRRGRLRRTDRRVPVGLGHRHLRRRDRQRHGADRQLRAADDVRGAVRALDGLPGVPAVADRPPSRGGPGRPLGRGRAGSPTAPR